MLYKDYDVETEEYTHLMKMKRQKSVMNTGVLNVKQKHLKKNVLFAGKKRQKVFRFRCIGVKIAIRQSYIR